MSRTLEVENNLRKEAENTMWSRDCREDELRVDIYSAQNTWVRNHTEGGSRDLNSSSEMPA